MGYTWQCEEIFRDVLRFCLQERGGGWIWMRASYMGVVRGSQASSIRKTSQRILHWLRTLKGGAVVGSALLFE
ncbi:hypothetical protein OIU79_002027 [Salix purpurea]|uniref:Uncharacterized protein n=1 Tax=Salix purpurea TaxID=77065 RepID=A0A9Q0UR72_SALPP|nr:hypothetical protein OIU79_002027 [Salix purpurea]